MWAIWFVGERDKKEYCMTVHAVACTNLRAPTQARTVDLNLAMPPHAMRTAPWPGQIPGTLPGIQTRPSQIHRRGQWPCSPQQDDGVSGRRGPTTGSVPTRLHRPDRIGIPRGQRGQDNGVSVYKITHSGQRCQGTTRSVHTRLHRPDGIISPR